MQQLEDDVRACDAQDVDVVESHVQSALHVLLLFCIQRRVVQNRAERMATVTCTTEEASQLGLGDQASRLLLLSRHWPRATIAADGRIQRPHGTIQEGERAFVANRIELENRNWRGAADGHTRKAKAHRGNATLGQHVCCCCTHPLQKLRLLQANLGSLKIGSAGLEIFAKV